MTWEVGKPEILELLAARDLERVHPNREGAEAALIAQGLRPTAKGGHLAVERAINAQFRKPPPSAAFRPFRRIRQTRNKAEYEHLFAVDTDLVHDDRLLVVRMHEVATALISKLPVFSP